MLTNDRFIMFSWDEFFKIVYVFFALAPFKLTPQNCTLPPPTVAGNTLAICTPTAAFTMTATGTNTLSWYEHPWGGSPIHQGSVLATPVLTTGTTYYVAQSSVATTATLTMPPYNMLFPATRGFWFQAPVSFNINGLWVPTDIGTGDASAAIIRLNSMPAPSVNYSNYNVLFLAQNVPGVAIMTVNVQVNAGDYIGVLGIREYSSSYAPLSMSSFVASMGTQTVLIKRLYAIASLQSSLSAVGTDPGQIARIQLFTSLGCHSALTPVQVSVVPHPYINVKASPPVVCTGATATLTADGMNTYTWSNSAQGSITSVSQSMNTTYTVSGALSAQCATTAVVTVSVDSPIITVSPSQPTVCAGNTIALTATGDGGGPFNWIGGITNGVPFSLNANASFIVSTSNACGTSTAAVTVTVHPNPVISVLGQQSVCAGHSITLNASGAVNYTWTPDGVNNSSISISPASATTYTVIGETVHGCVNTASHHVAVNPNPTVTAFTNSNIVCPGGSATLTAIGYGGVNYQWSHGPQTSVVTPVIQQPTAFTVSLTNQYNCVASAWVMVDVFQPTVAISGPAGVCEGRSVILYGGPAHTYTWLPLLTHQQSATFIPLNSATYTLLAVVDVGGIKCTASETINVSLHPNPTITIPVVRSKVCLNETGNLTAQGAATYTWSGFDGGASVTLSFTAIGLKTFTVTGTSAPGCTATAVTQVEVNACTGLNEVTETAAFSIFPNPSSGSIKIKAITSMRFTVMAESGQKVMCADANEGNGFTIDVSNLASGIYVVRNESGSMVRRFVVE